MEGGRVHGTQDSEAPVDVVGLLVGHCEAVDEVGEGVVGCRGPVALDADGVVDNGHGCRDFPKLRSCWSVVRERGYVGCKVCSLDGRVERMNVRGPNNPIVRPVTQVNAASRTTITRPHSSPDTRIPPKPSRSLFRPSHVAHLKHYDLDMTIQPWNGTVFALWQQLLTTNTSAEHSEDDTREPLVLLAGF